PHTMGVSRMIRRTLGAAALALAALVAPPAAQAADAPFAGSWKALIFQGNPNTGYQAAAICIVKVEGTDAKPEIKLVTACRQFADAKIEDVKVDAKGIQFRLVTDSLSITVKGNAPKGEDKPKGLPGTFQVQTQTIVARLDATDETELKAVTEEGLDGIAKLRG